VVVGREIPRAEGPQETENEGQVEIMLLQSQSRVQIIIVGRVAPKKSSKSGYEAIDEQFVAEIDHLKPKVPSHLHDLKVEGWVELKRVAGTSQV